MPGRVSSWRSLGHGFKSFGQGRAGHRDRQAPKEAGGLSGCPKKNGVPLPERGWGPQAGQTQTTDVHQTGQRGSATAFGSR